MNQGTQLQPVTPKTLIQQKSKMMIESLPGKESARKRFMQAALGVAAQPSIATCDPPSVLKAIYQCARLNLVPDPVLHHVAIVPFKNKGRKEATVIIEYRGLIELMKRANPALSIKAGTVYEHDDYELVEGTVDELKVTKRWWEKGKRDAGKPVLFYCVVREPGAEPVTQFVPAVEAEKIGRASKAGMKKGTPWHDHFERMGEKTAIKRIERFVRMDPDKEETKRFREALEFDENTSELPIDDDDDIMGSMGGGHDPAEDLDEGATRIGDAGNSHAPSAGAKRTTNPPAAVAESPAASSTAPPAEESTPSPTNEPEPPKEPDPNAPATRDDKKKMGMRIDAALSEAGLEVTEKNRYALATAASGLADFARDSINATHGDTVRWRETIKGYTSDEVRMYITGEVAAKAEAEPEPDGPFARVVTAWASQRGVSVDVATAAATRLLNFKHELEPEDLGDDEVTEQIIEAIRTGTTNLERYEKG